MTWVHGILKNTKEYKYLDVTLTKDGKDEKDIFQKIERIILSRLNSLLWNKDKRETIKKSLFTTLV